MSGVSEAYFIGGPLEGKTYCLEGSPPPSRIYTKALSKDQPDSEVLKFDKIEYVRQVSDLDYGPLWVYVAEEKK